MADIRRKGKVPFGDKLVDAELIDVQKADERWSVYQLDDGTELRFKAVVMEVWRVIGQYDELGNPFYVVRSQNLANPVVPEGLRKK